MCPPFEFGSLTPIALRLTPPTIVRNDTRENSKRVHAMRSIASLERDPSIDLRADDGHEPS